MKYAALLDEIRHKQKELFWQINKDTGPPVSTSQFYCSALKQVVFVLLSVYTIYGGVRDENRYEQPCLNY